MDGTKLPPAAAAATTDKAASFAELEREIRQIDIDAETITLTYHLRKFAELFQARVADDETLGELFTYLNRCALKDSKFAVNMAAVFASRQLDDLVIKETKLRNAMLTILQQNFQGIEDLKREGLSRFYNSITLLGEYYHRKKFANGKRILILGQSLLLLLTTELENEIKKCDEVAGYTIDPEFAKVILTQVTLNGGEAKQEHRQEIDDLNYSIRKCLINVDSMTSKAKAFLLMALDLFYTNFNLSQKLLEKLYGKYLFEPDEDTSTKQAKGSKPEVKEVKAIPEKQAPAKPSTGNNGNGAAAGSSKSAPKKVVEKTENNSRRNRHAKPPASAKPHRKEDSNSDPVPKSPRTPPKKSPQPRRPPLNHTTPPSKKDQQRPKVQPSPPKSSLQRRTPPEKLKPPMTPDSTPPPSKPSNSSSSVLKQNCKGSAKSSTSPVQSNNSEPAALKLQMPAATVQQHDDNVENLAWDDLTLEDESPQKINPHTKSFLSFLAQK